MIFDVILEELDEVTGGMMMMMIEFLSTEQ